MGHTSASIMYTIWEAVVDVDAPFSSVKCDGGCLYLRTRRWIQEERPDCFTGGRTLILSPRGQLSGSSLSKELHARHTDEKLTFFSLLLTLTGKTRSPQRGGGPVLHP